MPEDADASDAPVLSERHAELLIGRWRVHFAVPAIGQRMFINRLVGGVVFSGDFDEGPASFRATSRFLVKPVKAGP